MSRYRFAEGPNPWTGRPSRTVARPTSTRAETPRQGKPSCESTTASTTHDGALKRKSSQELQADLTQMRSVDVRPDEPSPGTETRPRLTKALAIGCPRKGADGRRGWPEYKAPR
jgi:hypothetical protein